MSVCACACACVRVCACLCSTAYNPSISSAATHLIQTYPGSNPQVRSENSQHAAAIAKIDAGIRRLHNKIEKVASGDDTEDEHPLDAGTRTTKRGAGGGARGAVDTMWWQKRDHTQTKEEYEEEQKAERRHYKEPLMAICLSFEESVLQRGKMVPMLDGIARDMSRSSLEIGDYLQQQVNISSVMRFIQLKPEDAPDTHQDIR